MPSLRDLPPDELQRLHANTAVLLVSGLTEGCEAGCDGSLFQVAKCSGWKLLPPGLHMFVYSSPQSSGISNRHAQLRFVAAKEVMVRTWTRKGLQSSQDPPAKRRRSTAVAPAPATVVSPDYIKSADAELAPYPFDKADEWKSLTSFVDIACLCRVIGLDENGDAVVDAQMPSTADEILVGQTKQWGKKRELEPAPKDEQEELLQFVKFDLRRSWQEGSTGEELSRNARDKSWLLGQVLWRQLDSKRDQLLAEMQLAFVLFTQIHNFSALEAYKRLLSLVAHAQNFFLPSNPGCLHFARQLIQTVLTPQFRSLRDEFFTLDLPELDAYFLSELGQLRTCLNEAAKAWRSSTSPNERAEWSEFVSGIWQPFVDLVASKFGWRFGSLDEFADVKGKTLHYNLLQEDDLLAEEGEDAPQVVDVDDFDAI